jgi:hypothetical protein
MLQFRFPTLRSEVSLERSMDRFYSHRPTVRFTPFEPRGGQRFRWRVGNSSTKVLFRHPAKPSTFKPHAAAPALLLLNASGQLSLRARNP